MKIYIEDFLFQQTITTFCLVRLLNVTTKNKTKPVRVLIVLLIDAIVSIIISTNSLNYYLYTFIYYIEPFILICLLYKVNFKQKVLSYFIFQFFSLSLKGTIINLASTTFYSSLGIITYTKYSPLILISAIIIFSYIYEVVLSSAKLRIKSNSLVYKISIYQNKKKFELNAYIDTGNLANLNGKGLTIIDYLTFLDIQLSCKTKLSPVVSINVNTINSNKEIPIYIIDKIEIHLGKEKKVYLNYPIGVTSSNIFSNKNYEALISPELI